MWAEPLSPGTRPTGQVGCLLQRATGVQVPVVPVGGLWDTAGNRSRNPRIRPLPSGPGAHWAQPSPSCRAAGSPGQPVPLSLALSCRDLVLAFKEKMTPTVQIINGKALVISLMVFDIEGR